MQTRDPTLGNGKICHLEIPAADIQESSSFYQAVFGWQIRVNKDGHVSFNDGVGEVSGTWVLGRKPMREPGIVISIMVDNAKTTMEAIASHGGKVTQAQTLDSGPVVAVFTDPAGNMMTIFQHEPEPK